MIRAEQFTAYDDTGAEYTVLINRTHRRTTAHDDAREGSVEIDKELVTANGDHVNRIKKGVYKVTATDTIIRSSDANAP